MQITETIVHGDYRSTRTADMALTWTAFVQFLLGSPYIAAWTPDALAGNTSVAKLFADLLNKGSGYWGWADYKLTGA